MQQLTKRVLESADEGAITDHLGYDKHDPAGRGTGSSRNGLRSKTVLTEVALTALNASEIAFDGRLTAGRN